MFRAVGPLTGVSGDVGLETCTGMWGPQRRAQVTVDVAQDMQLLLLDRTIFGQFPFMEGFREAEQIAKRFARSIA
jgi:hypothetical protein